MPNPLSLKPARFDKPYAIFIKDHGWHLAGSSRPTRYRTSEAKDKFARWYVAANSSPMSDMTSGSTATPTSYRHRYLRPPNMGFTRVGRGLR
jgi:hypothetical protein